MATGDSPFNFTSKSGLLAQGNTTLASAGSVEVRVTPIEPYLYLPPSTCQAIAAELPVSYNAALGLYLWETTSSLYENIVSSPSYLGFTFRYGGGGSDAQNLTIKVPFMLLNLTLEPPLVAAPVPYFPCSPITSGYMQLGRAFLQAAFMGINFRENYAGSWFLAQAPGPNISSPNIVGIATNDDALLGSDLVWEDTWTGVWTPISGDSAATSTPGSGSSTVSDSQSSTNGTSTGLITGLSVGLSLLGLAVVGLGLWWRRKQSMRAQEQGLNSGKPGQTPPMASKCHSVTTATRELEGHSFAAELTGRREPAELSGRPRRAELSDESRRYEMAG